MGMAESVQIELAKQCRIECNRGHALAIDRCEVCANSAHDRSARSSLPHNFANRPSLSLRLPAPSVTLTTLMSASRRVVAAPISGSVQKTVVPVAVQGSAEYFIVGAQGGVSICINSSSIAASALPRSSPHVAVVPAVL